MMKILFTTLIGALLFAVAAESINLRGYGRVEAEFGDSTTEFRCESPAQAALLYAKLYRDLTGFGARPATRQELERNGRKYPVLRFADGRAAALGLRDRVVVVVEAENPEALAGEARLDALQFPEPQPYPGYLDYFDLRALKFYKRPQQSLLGYGIEKHWPFAKQHGIAGFVTHGLALSDCPAPGVVSFAPFDYELEAARQADGILTLCPTFGGAFPLWLYNRYPEKTARVQHSTLVTNWNHGVDGASYDNDGPGFAPENSPQLAFQRQVMERYVNHPALGGWQLYCGKPIGDQLGVAMGGTLWDASEEGLRAQIDYFRKHYTLPELSRRWTGDAGTFRSWDDVEPIQLMDLIGGDYDTGRLLLSDRVWEWRKTPPGALGQPPVEDGKPWVPLHFPPSQRANFLDSGSGYYRLRLQAPEWLQGRTGKKLYLKAAVNIYDHHRLIAWVNGVKLQSEPPYSAGTKLLGIEIPPGTLKGDGSDLIVLQTPDGRSDGRLHGPVSLSERPAENYPYADARLNARYYDAKRFQSDMVVERNRRMFAAARALDPNRPLCLSGADTPIMAELAPFFGEQGIAMQSTSTDGFFYPALPDRGEQYGFYFVGEPSGPVDTVDRFDRMFGILFYHGCSATSIFMDLEQYMKFEEQTGHLSRRAPLLRLLGKYLNEPSSIALLNTTASHLLGTPAPWRWNLGRGELQSSHFTCSMLTEKELANGIADRYPLLVDAASDVMDEATVAALRRYVERGGTFVALPPSGRHSVEQQNAQPLSALTGFRTVRSGRRGAIRFAEEPSLFRRWRGQTRNGDGNALDWQNNRSADGVELEALAPEVEVIARWADNEAPAIGLRRLGKGRVITFGAPFWRDGRDLNGKWLPSRRNQELEAVFSELGAVRNAGASSERIWVRKATTKNGLEDWLIATNIAENEPFTLDAELTLCLDREPFAAYDAETGKAVPFHYADGVVTLEGVHFDKYQTRVFAFPRRQPVAGALRTWWQEKSRYWRRGPALPLPTAPVTEPEALVFRDFQVAPAAGVPDAWTGVGFDASGWQPLPVGNWQLLAPNLATYVGALLYRREFELPEAWRGRRIILDFHYNAIRDQAEFFLNGRKITSYDRDRQHPELLGQQSFDVTDELKFGAPNVLAVKVTGGKTKLAGICDNVYLAPETELRDEISLDGAWECVQSDFLTTVPATVPGRAHGRFLRRKFTVPAAWRGKTVYLRVETPVVNLAAVVINDRNKNLDSGFPPFGLRTEINVTEFLKPGEENVIELWHRHTIPVNWRGLGWNWPKESQLSVDHLTLGVVEQ